MGRCDAKAGEKLLEDWIMDLEREKSDPCWLAVSHLSALDEKGNARDYAMSINSKSRSLPQSAGFSTCISHS